MPSFADNIKPEEAWDLVFYLRSLQPMRTKEKDLATQLGLKPINPNAAPSTADPQQGVNDTRRFQRFQIGRKHCCGNTVDFDGVRVGKRTMLEFTGVDAA
jgi:hypothetical protein